MVIAFPGGSFENFIEDPSGQGRYNKVMVIQMEENHGKVRYIDVTTMEYDKRDETRLMYKTGTPNGTDLSPTAKITQPNRTLKNKIIKRLVEVSENKLDETYKVEQDLVREMAIILKENESSIINKMNGIFRSKDRDDLFIVTISLIQAGQERYPGDFPIFQKTFVEDALKSMYYRTTGKLDTRRDSGVCCVCLEKDKRYMG